MKQLPKGLWPVMLTPLKENNSLDLEGLKRLTEFYIASGADGLFANCLSSEMFQLTENERLLITKTVIEKVGGRIPVVSTGSFGTDMNATSVFVQKLFDTGTTAVIISTSQPCNELEKDDAFKNKIEALMKKTKNIPLGLYECPLPYRRLMSSDMLKWLSQSERFLYHKDTSCNLEEIRKKIEATKDTPLGIYNAHVPTGVDSIRSGARGLSPIAANLYPELFRYLLKYLEEDSKKGEIKKLSDTLDLMDTIVHYNYPYSAKLFLQKRGFDITTNSRIPRLPMKAQDLNKLDTVLRVFKDFSQELDIDITNM